MELVKNRNWTYTIIGFVTLMILTLGAWWIYLAFKLGNSLNNLDPKVYSQVKLAKMLKWEGSFFLGLLLILCFFLIYAYIQDARKAASLQAFFASLTHELKTPLASIRLQSSFINEIVDQRDNLDYDQLSKLTDRLIQDTQRLELELDKTLQLSRVERGGLLNPTPISLEEMILKISKNYPSIDVDIRNNTQENVLADEFAISIILRNLFENTLKHNLNKDKKVTLHIKEIGQKIELLYDDHGQKFEGDLNQLGKLFYKFKSSKGSGIGLYLCKKLISKMSGNLNFQNSDRFKISFSLPRAMEVA